MCYGVDATVNAVQTSSGYPRPGAARCQSGIYELEQRDNAVLARGERRDRSARGLVELRLTMQRNSTNPFHASIVTVRGLRVARGA